VPKQEIGVLTCGDASELKRSTMEQWRTGGDHNYEAAGSQSGSHHCRLEEEGEAKLEINRPVGDLP